MRKLIILALATLVAVSLCSVFASAEETNVAKGKSYTYTGAYTDNNGVALYPDKGGVLTDGVAAKGTNDLGYDKPVWVGMNANAKDLNGAGKYQIVVDLGSTVSKITKFTVNTQTCGGGVAAPKEVEVLLSTDNSSFTSAGKTTKGTKIFDGATSDPATKDYGIYEFTISTAEKSARYVKYVITFNMSWCFVSEVGAYTGAAPATSAAESETSGTESVSSAPATSGVSSAAASSAASAAASSKAASSKAASSAVSPAANDGDDGLGTGAIIGIVAGAVVVIGVVVYLATRKKK